MCLPTRDRQVVCTLELGLQNVSEGEQYPIPALALTWDQELDLTTPTSKALS